MAHSPKSVRRLLKDKPTLKTLELEISAQKALLAEVRRALPSDLAGHCIAARLQGPTLVLHTDSPAWATRLRFLANELRSLLQPRHRVLREIKIRLLPPHNPPDRRRSKARKSRFGAAIVLECAKDTDQPQLREALERLGRRLQETPS